MGFLGLGGDEILGRKVLLTNFMAGCRVGESEAGWTRTVGGNRFRFTTPERDSGSTVPAGVSDLPSYFKKFSPSILLQNHNKSIIYL